MAQDAAVSRCPGSDEPFWGRSEERIGDDAGSKGASYSCCAEA
jgi:hypothetical protein